MAKLKGDETQPCACKYPTTLCALAKILTETTMRALFCQIKNALPTTKHISYFFNNKFSLSLYVCTRGMLGCPRRVLASGPKLCRGKDIYGKTKEEFVFWNYELLYKVKTVDLPWQQSAWLFKVRDIVNKTAKIVTRQWQ